MDVRERAGCSLAKSGMLTCEQRMKAMPGLLELTDDPSLNATTRLWVYQALREITNENLPKDRKSTRLNSSHSQISYAVFCLKKKTKPASRTHDCDLTYIH